MSIIKEISIKSKCFLIRYGRSFTVSNLGQVTSLFDESSYGNEHLASLGSYQLIGSDTLMITGGRPGYDVRPTFPVTNIDTCQCSVIQLKKQYLLPNLFKETSWSGDGTDGLFFHFQFHGENLLDIMVGDTLYRVEAYIRDELP